MGKHQISENCFCAFGVNIQFQNHEFYYLMEEKKLYSLEQMLAEIGGLLIGMSALSLIEILSFTGMTIMKKLTRPTPTTDTEI